MTTTMTRPNTANLDFAKRLFQRGTDCLGPQEVQTVFDISLPNAVPLIPFTETELQRARELGQILVLFVPNDADGNALTMSGLYDLLGDKLGTGKLLYDTDWYKDEVFFTKDVVATTATWKLVSNDVIPGSADANYFGQTEALARYLVEEVYKDLEIPALYQAALDEFADRKDELAKMMQSDDWQKTAEVLGSLRLNQLFRPSPGETLYTIALYMGVNNERLLEDMYHWSASRSSRGSLVHLGSAVSRGVLVDGRGPGYSRSHLGVVFSRSGLAES